MRRILVLTLFGLCLAGTILYAADYASVRLAHDPFGSVVVTRYHLIPKKNGSTEIVFQPAQPQQCVHSLFAHEGYLPCWYLSRHREQSIKM
jgi:hypothetical protein